MIGHSGPIIWLIKIICVMQPLTPILTLPLFPLLDQKLGEVLGGLSPQEWERPTVAPGWRVKDVAAHLLDGNLRTLAILRDGYSGDPPGPIASYSDLVGYLNRLNADWVQAMRRLSPAILVELLTTTGAQYTAYLQSLDPMAPATFAVAWAGESQSANWFHIAREYTEKWHHQQQIRLAVGQAHALYHPTFYYPYLDTSARALPHHYRAVGGQEGDLLQLHVTGQGGGVWQLYFGQGSWQLVTGHGQAPTCLVELPGEVAWRVFTKGITATEARAHARVQGHEALASHLFSMLAVMA
jgi:uncharacterized protein (TIGR03083 family)